MGLLRNHAWIRAEFILLFVLLPAFLAVAMPPRVLFGVLWVMAIYAMVVTRVTVPEKGRVPHDWDWSATKKWAHWRPLLKRFALALAGLVGLTLVLLPERFLAFPLHRPELWVLVMVLYPLLSVVPQEFIYRSFFFERYAELFKKPSHMVWASAIAFGYGHIVFLNWVAVGLCLVGGLYFAQTYQRHRSLSLVCAEHAIYGCTVFTVGLGWYFYQGGARAAVIAAGG